MRLVKILLLLISATQLAYTAPYKNPIEKFYWQYPGLEKTEAGDSILYYWLQVIDNNNYAVRAIVNNNKCPDITVGHQAFRMRIRSASNNDTFPINTCEIKLPSTVRNITLNGKPLKTLPAEIQRIAIIGDTGCRINSSATDIQDCNDKDKWPFEKIANRIAEHEKPDLVIHVGDYHYREGKCPAGDRRCEGSPYGYNWPVWRADLFAPADNLLANYPWLFIRGNHEVCPTVSNHNKGRAWRGWKRFLSPYEYVDHGCSTEKFFMVTLPLKDSTLSLAVIDSSPLQSNYSGGEEELFTNYYFRTFQKILEMTEHNTWLLFHHPLWYQYILGDEVKEGNKLLQNSLKRIYGDKEPSHIENEYIRMIISGHMHLPALFNFSVNSPFTRSQSQMIIGNSGSSLYDNKIGEEVDGIRVDPKNSFIKQEYGYTIAERDENNGNGLWRFLYKDVDGQIMVICFLIDDTEFQRCQIFPPIS